METPGGGVDLGRLPHLPGASLSPEFRQTEGLLSGTEGSSVFLSGSGPWVRGGPGGRGGGSGDGVVDVVLAQWLQHGEGGAAADPDAAGGVAEDHAGREAGPEQ